MTCDNCIHRPVCVIRKEFLAGLDRVDSAIKMGGGPVVGGTSPPVTKLYRFLPTICMNMEARNDT
jgi:hypothetical protein